MTSGKSSFARAGYVFTLGYRACRTGEVCEAAGVEVTLDPGKSSGDHCAWTRVWRGRILNRRVSTATFRA